MHALPSPLRFHWQVTALAALAAVVITLLVASPPNLAGGRSVTVSPLQTTHGAGLAAPTRAAKAMWLSHPLGPPTVELSNLSSEMSTTARASVAAARANPHLAPKGRPRAAWP
jgi:hypothetical protein